MDWSCRKGESNVNYEIHSDGTTHGVCAKCEYWHDCLKEVKQYAERCIAELKGEVITNGDEEG